MKIGLVACCSAKLPHAAPARDLYVSPLFTKSRAYVERTCGKWFILSAKHFLVDPDQVLAPYDESLNERPPVHRRLTMKEYHGWWGCHTGYQLRVRVLLPNPGCELVVLAGEAYRTCLTASHTADVVRDYCRCVHYPLAGLGIGEQLAHLDLLNGLAKGAARG